MTRRRDPWLAVALAVSLILLVLVVLPQLWLLRASLTGPGGSLTLANFGHFFREARYLAALRNSVFLSLLVCAFAMAVAVPLAFVHARYLLPGKGAILTLAAMATVTPPFLGAYVWIMLLGLERVPLLRACARSASPSTASSGSPASCGWGPGARSASCSCSPTTRSPAWTRRSRKRP